MSEEKEEKKEGEAAPKKGKKKLIIIIVAALILIGGGAGAFLMLGKAKEPAEGHEVEAEHEVAVHLETLKLEPFIVNLSENTAFLKVTILLEYNAALLEKTAATEGAHGSGGGEEKGGGTHPAFAAREPMIRDAIIKVLSSKTSEEVLKPDGKIKLKEEILESVNEALGFEEPAVVNIYFTEFIIQ